MTHYEAKQQAEQEIKKILELVGFASGNDISNQSELIASDKPLYYHIEAHELADSANIDGACVYAVYRHIGSDNLYNDNSNDYVQMSYSMSLTSGGKQETIIEYISKLQATFSDNDWIYSYISEDKIKDVSGSIKPLVQIVYNLDKVMYNSIAII